MRFDVRINGLEVNAVYSRDSIENIFVPLLRKLTKMRREKNGRVLALFAAPPGAGKSTLLSFLAKLAEEDEQSDEVQVLGM
ncbi:MAG: kinase, partial [Lachnospiraceae bacterium]|nr:kinase [Lachnospiraceae bacterium]